MQVQPAAVSGAGAATSREVTRGADRALLPDAFQVLMPGPAQVDRREQLVEKWEQDRRRKVAANEAAIAEAARAPRPSELIVQAERRMLPGSRAAREQQVESQAREQRASGDRPELAFRQALDQARQSPRPHQRAVAQRCLAESTGSPAEERTPAGPATAAAGAQSVAGGAKPAEGGGPPAGANGESRSANRQHATQGPRTTNSEAQAARVDAAFHVARLRLPAAVNVDLRATTVGRVALQSGGGTPLRTAAVAAPQATAGECVASRRAQLRSPAGAQAVAELRGNTDANVERVLRLILTRIGRDRSVATLRLDPPELGTVRLRLDLRHDQLTLLARTDTPAAQRLLEENLDVLRRRLEVSGIQLERAEIRPVAGPTEAARPDAPPHGSDDAGGFARQEADTAGGGAHGDWESPSESSPPAAANAVEDAGQVGRRAMELTAPSQVNVMA